MFHNNYVRVRFLGHSKCYDLKVIKIFLTKRRRELSYMDDDERCEALEDAGLDPDDYDFQEVELRLD